MRTSQYRPGRNPNSLKNLKRNTDRDPEELREMGRKGGKASGKTRRRKAIMNRIVKKMIDGYMDWFQVMECTVSDMAAELDIPEKQVPALAWLVLNLFSDLGEGNRHDIMTLEALREIGLTEERAAEILRRWDQAMKETPEPGGNIPEMIRKYREVGGIY